MKKLLAADLFTRTNSLKGGEKMDWNHDGKHNWQDHAFYNNVVEPGMKKDSSLRSASSSNKNTSNQLHNTSESNSHALTIFIVICVVYFFIKLIGG